MSIDIVIYKVGKKPELEVKLKQETVWLTQQQMSTLFKKAISTINEHINNIYKEKELSKPATIRKFRIVQKEGQRKVEREVDF